VKFTQTTVKFLRKGDNPANAGVNMRLNVRGILPNFFKATDEEITASPEAVVDGYIERGTSTIYTSHFSVLGALKEAGEAIITRVCENNLNMLLVALNKAKVGIVSIRQEAGELFADPFSRSVKENGEVEHPMWKHFIYDITLDEPSVAGVRAFVTKSMAEDAIQDMKKADLLGDAASLDVSI
jgi:hypothetical protein